MIRPGRLYPFVLAAVPVLHILAENPGVSSGWDQIVVLGTTLLVTLLTYLAARLLLRRLDAGRLAPLVATLVMGWLLGFRLLADAARSAGLPQAQWVLAPVLLLATGAVLARAWRRPEALDRIGSFLTLTGALMAAFALTSILADHARSRRLLRESRLLGELEQPIPGPAVPPAPERDIYVLILDQYANSAVLRERFGYDNRPFEDSLRALGFHVPALVRSNYAHTLLSLPSLLNAAHVTTLEREMGRRGSDPSVANELVGRSRVAEFVKARGYRYVFYPSQWWYATSGTPQADVEPQVWGGFALGRELGRTALRRAVLDVALLPPALLQASVWDADHVRRTLRGVTLARRFGQPVFVVAHLISPHPPYAVDAECRSPPRKRSYKGQIECLNRRVLATVRELIRESDVPPVIILQGDHGSKSLRFNDWPSAAQVPADAARERFGAFGAYYLPAGGARAFGDTVTVVNVLGNVLRYYMGARLPREPDAQYLSLEHTPYDFRRVDPAWLGASAAEPPATPSRLVGH